MKKIISVFLCLALLLLPGGVCAQSETPHFSDMVYSRPDLGDLQTLLDETCTLAQGRDVNAILNSVFSFYDAYDRLYTCAALADIHYSADLTDEAWAEENDYCLRIQPQVEQMADSLYAALAQSPCRAQLEKRYFGLGFFQSYQDSSLWDDYLLELMDQENALISQYYTQCSEEEQRFFRFLFPNPTPKAETLVALIQVRNEMADYCGYDCYEDFANDFYYYRDYTDEDMAAYLEQIQQQLVELYRRSIKLNLAYAPTTESQTLDYLRTAAKNMGGDIWDSFCVLEEGGLYDIAPGKNKYNASFEVYLYSYYVPFLFLNPQQNTYDHLSIAHEFGHFSSDYLSYGSQTGIDVSEFFSQGMEYLTLCYGQDTQELTRLKMLDSLCVFVEQACYASFERQMYRIPAEELSVETLCSLYERTALDYGFDALGYDRTEFVDITHFYTNPMYVFSYIISNDAAMQLYQMECENPGQGLASYTRNLTTEQPYFLAFLQEAQMESPFAAHRLEHVRETFRQILQG